MKKYFQEFREFAVKGNVVDLAVAVIIGAAFGKIVSSLVSDIVMPLVGFIAGGLDFTVWKIVLRSAIIGPEGEILKPELVLSAGNFIQNIFDFLVIALSVFLMVKFLNRVKNKLAQDFLVKKKAEKEVEEDVKKEESPILLTKDQELLVEIRDLLKNKKPENQNKSLN
ncbi:large conductance mechanosensitive channel protein MscL [Candidatus Falkowbacteria bacterium]|nr:large conductance mechanosensitive channel protein MscL [Candidatus Falkowbacteria bacterium]NCT54448.1 large conductance mechanosensitive channel protein MscL [Candidatus Falkowbacteria bacterium]